MNKGTKVAIGVLATSLCVFFSYGAVTHSDAAKVPGLDERIQVLEQSVKEERLKNNKLILENNSLSNMNGRLISYNQLVLEKLNQSKIRIRQLENEVKKKQELKKMTGFEITWYNDTGATFSGRQTVDGVTISVDPSVIPLGTWVRIVFPDGTSIERRADDTGKKVKDKVIDVYKKDSHSNLMKLGRTYGATVYILDK